MAPSIALVAIIVMAVGGYVGWHIRQAIGLNSDIKTYKTRIPKFRAKRNRSWAVAAVALAVTLILLSKIRLCRPARHHRDRGTGNHSCRAPLSALAPH